MKIEQPRNLGISLNAKAAGTLEWNKAFAGQWNGRYDLAQQFVDNSVLRYSEPYLPFQTGMLRNSGITGSIPGTGEVVWNAPYARFLYYGKVMVSPSTGSSWAKSGERKVLTDRSLTYHGAPKRGAFWFERMKADHKESILQGAKKIIGGNG